MNNDYSPELPGLVNPVPEPEPMPSGLSSLYRLFEAFITLREKNERQHKLFEQSLNRTRDGLQGSFNNFINETHKAYQQLRQELNGEKRFSLVVLNELVDMGLELGQIASARPQVPLAGPEGDAVSGWMEAVEIQARKIQNALEKLGVRRYDALVGSPYNPALHERVGSRRLDGLDAYRVAEQREPGYASQAPDFVLRRAKVIVSE